MVSSLSSRSRAILAGLPLAVIALLITRSVLEANTVTATAIANAPAVLFSVFSAVFILWVALRFAPDEQVRRPWIAIGLAMGATAIAEILWAFYEVVLRIEVPYPGIPDVFYLACYPLFAAGIVMAIRSFRGLVPTGRAALTSGLVCAGVSIWLYFAVLDMIMRDTELTAATKFVSLFYPLGDVWLMLFPALVLAIMLSSLAGGRIAWPWWAVVAGCASIAIADALFTVADWNGTYATGSAVDAGWWIGYVLLAFGASLFLDIQKPDLAHARQANAQGEAVAS